MAHARQVIRTLIKDFPPHKLAYMLQHPDLVNGLKKNLVPYGVTYDRSVHDELVDLVDTHLGGGEVEFEWNELQYEHFVQFKEIVS